MSLPAKKLNKESCVKQSGHIAQNAAYGYWELDLETQALKWSDEQYRIYGYDPGELKLDNNFFVMETTHYSETERVSKIIANAIRHHNDYAFRRRTVKKNGRLGFVETNAVIIRSAEGKAIKISGTTIDVSGKKEMELLDYNDPAYFNFLYDNYRKTIHFEILKIIGDKALADDLCQEIFLKFWNNILQYDPGRGAIYTWMLSITRNHCRDFLRSKYSRLKKITDRLDLTFDEELKTDFINHEALEPEICLATLTPVQSGLIDLLFIQGYTQEEV
ncbi:MAG: sigma-70 family RNA polymerase sigma factor, partial [Bacteroidia bacterium]